MNLIEKNWNEILEHVRKEHELSDVSFETWLLPLKVHSAENHVVKIIVPMGEQMITYLNSKFKTPIFVAIAEFTGEKYEVEFITEKEAAEQNYRKRSGRTENCLRQALERQRGRSEHGKY